MDLRHTKKNLLCTYVALLITKYIKKPVLLCMQVWNTNDSMGAMHYCVVQKKHIAFIGNTFSFAYSILVETYLTRIL